MTLYAFNVNGNRGIGAYLGNVQKLGTENPSADAAGQKMILRLKKMMIFSLTRGKERRW